jgi:hypothetical protein
METSSHILWATINEHEKNIIIIMKTFKEKGLEGILFGQFCSLTIP